MSARRILVVEHDQPTRELLCDHLADDRFDVKGVEGIDRARSLLGNVPFDLVLLDLALPDGQAGTLLSEIREEHPNIGVIVVSGRGTERERVKAMTEGADDYVMKPFAYSELLARINAVLRRIASSGSVAKAGGIELSRIGRTVKVDGRPVNLSAKEFALLSVLMTEPTRVFSKEELLQEVWGYRSIGHTRTLEAHASRLRRKLNRDGGGRYVINCWGVGYRLINTIEHRDEPVESKADDEGGDATDMSVERSTFTVIGYCHKYGAITMSVVQAANVSAAREAVEAKTDTKWEWRANFEGDVRTMGLGTGDDIEIEVIA